MYKTPRLIRSFPFWLLIVGSLASIGYGIWLTIDKLSIMTSTLNDGTATGVEVYAGQSWAVFAAAFVGAGLVGLVAALAVSIAATLFARPVEVVEAIDWSADDEQIDDEDESPAAEDDFAAQDATTDETVVADSEPAAEPASR